ncbi:MAG TPA: DUF499 domain-containing protein [Syntrophales bacterium]|nr:DUF499 domain-containing protein [Syntrophales bacterium]HOM08134.1 DUF499 domain-containing protein [Syntrophales bacterium]
MALKPWFKVVTPREDLREGRPLDASEFAVHLDQVRDGRAPVDYQNPERFFERTYMTQSLSGLASEVLRRLSGIKTETSPIFNMTTQFGGGKTHALTLLYHLATQGNDARNWRGVTGLLAKADVKSVPKAVTAIFVGTEFDSITGRGGHDGTPLRKTPWGEIAFQLGGVEGFSAVAEHDEKLIAPAGDVIRRFLPQGAPCLILLDELMNYVSRNRKSGLAAQFYDFLQNLSETIRAEDKAVLAVSIPASEGEMNAEDQGDYERFKKLLDRLGKAVIMSAESETSEIIRRRLFEWGGLPDDGKKTVGEYADWVIEHRNQVPSLFPVDQARDVFAAAYPFHPMVLSVFERKWQMLPRFQRTRGVLRLLALWVSRVYQEGYKGGYRDPLITLGTAPLDDPLFRAAVFEQLGESRLEGAVTTDICGKKESFATQMDKEAVEAIKKARLHRKVATTIFFESNGGQLRTEATLPEIRLGVAEPDLDIGNVETVLETLATNCYFLKVEKNRYRFSFTPNLNKLLADRRATIQEPQIKECVRSEVQKIFSAGAGAERVYFPEKSGQIPDRPALTFVIIAPEQSLQDNGKLTQAIEAMTKEYGTSARTFKSALIWCVPETTAMLRDEARKLLAWEAIDDEAGTLKLDEVQKRQLAENLKKAQRDLRESVWRTYKNLLLLDKENRMRTIDLGLVHSSAAENMVTLILNRLRQDGDVEDGISPNFLIRNWPPAFTEWSTKSVRDAFFASPQFPKLLNAEVVKDTIARGVSNGLLAYVGKKGDGYDPFIYGVDLNSKDVEISDDMFIIRKETVEAYKSKVRAGAPSQPAPDMKSEGKPDITVPKEPEEIQEKPAQPPSGAPVTTRLSWSGEIPPQKWMNFYTKVLSKYAVGNEMKITLNVEVKQAGGISSQKIEETKTALRELGMGDDVKAE